MVKDTKDRDEKYELIKNVRDGFDLEEMNNKYTEYFEIHYKMSDKG